MSFRLEGTEIVIRDVYQAQADETGYASTRVTLDAHGSGTGLNIFEVSGSGDVKAGPHLSCTGLVSPDELSHCPLGAPPTPCANAGGTATAPTHMPPRFTRADAALAVPSAGIHFKLKHLEHPMVQKDESGKKVGTTTGAFSAHLKIDTWIESSDIRITFGHSRVEFSEVWNARLIDGQMHDGSIENEGAVGSTHATFRIKKMPGSWVGERKSAFGFMALGPPPLAAPPISPATRHTHRCRRRRR